MRLSPFSTVPTDGHRVWMSPTPPCSRDLCLWGASEGTSHVPTEQPITMRRHGFARPLLLAALCAGALGVVAWLDASPREVPACVAVHPTHRMGPLPAGQYVSDGGCQVWLARQEEYRNLDLRGWLMGAADFHGCTFTACDFRGAVLSHANLRGALLWECDLRGADLEFADLTGATYDIFTRWPEGFDPRAHGARCDTPGQSDRPPKWSDGFSPEGRTLVVGSYDATVQQVGDAASGQLLRTYHQGASRRRGARR